MRITTSVMVAALLALGGRYAATSTSATNVEQAPTDPLPATCNPFGALATVRPVDQSCGLQGSPAGTSGQKAQDRVKNNLCAFQDRAPAPVTRRTFDRLQTLTPSKAALPWGTRTNIPASDAARAPLQGLYTTTEGDTVGEGAYVEFVAFILEGHFGGAESVNCDLTTRQNVDVHLALVTNKPSTLDLTNDDTECSSITAEITGHRRPIDWEFLGRMTSAVPGQKLIAAQRKLGDEDLKRPVRVRGQLMFDASHGLCDRNGHRTASNPARRAGWEIHPVYAIDVCHASTLATCTVDNPARWTPLDQFLQVGPDSD